MSGLDINGWREKFPDIDLHTTAFPPENRVRNKHQVL